MTLGRSDEYKKAGVNIDAASEWVLRIKELAARSHSDAVLSGIGGFSGLYSMKEFGAENLVLAAGSDGVGTKVIVAQMMGKNDTVGIDLVAMNVDDVVTSGAKPLFFLDYISGASLSPKVVEDIVSGVVEGCVRAGCALLGGETAQMPDLYSPGEYDLAGFCVGAVMRSEIIDGKSIRKGDVLLGLGSTGLHSNGYTLARRVFLETAGWHIDRYVEEFGRTLGEELLEPTRIYAPFILKLKEAVPLKGIVHVTGGGLIENVPRIMPEGLKMRLSKDWEIPRVFELLQELGGIPSDEMYRVFNMGVGMVVVVQATDADRVISISKESQIPCFVVGDIDER
ncbi:MAG TPA: phosphoribosylformylglycinamidine cyclo-ligase [Bacillota bacterium]|nr:phosphoribosylformylglycinamidine cyclo-ligase [Bacillota bacterium]